MSRSFSPSNIDVGKLPPASLTALIEVHALQALIMCGVQAEPQSGETDTNLPMAKYNIDTLEVLKEKTEGNRTDEEEQALEKYLHLARTAYMKVSERQGGGA